jgi:hypothetical protein
VIKPGPNSSRNPWTPRFWLGGVPTSGTLLGTSSASSCHCPVYLTKRAAYPDWQTHRFVGKIRISHFFFGTFLPGLRALCNLSSFFGLNLNVSIPTLFQAELEYLRFDDFLLSGRRLAPVMPASCFTL